jgi:large subunit ribosomal protein L17
MRHRRKTSKLQRTKAQRRSLFANQVCSLIEHRQIRTTLAKAKALRPVAEKMVTIAKKGVAAEAAGDTAKGVHYRRQAMGFLRQKGAVTKLFSEVAPASATRPGGYTRVTKLGARFSDAAPMAFISWVDLFVENGDDDEVLGEAAES